MRAGDEPACDDRDLAARVAWRSDGDEIWQAWRGLEDWENLVDARFDLSFGRHLLVLWALYTFRGGPEDVIGELVADDLEPQFGDPIVEDMVRTAFALGASWAAAQPRPRGAHPTARGSAKPRLRVANR